MAYPQPPAGALHEHRAKARAASVTAVLGPTNTGKTYFAIERMLAHPSGIIGLPLRLLAREVYNRVVEKVGAEAVALITGEEKIKPRHPRYWIATVEAMPRDLDVSFVAIDEIQLAADLDRGHVFTDRLLHRRGRDETLIIGAMTMKRAVEQLLPGVTVVSRPRLSKLSFAGEKKLSRLPHRSAIVAFSAEEVYAIAELLRRQRGGAAVVLGALSPRTRNSQVEMYQNGDVDYLVATDAIGMGLNLDLDHVAFAGDRKFDGWQYRRLNPSEMGQIAGRAGRHLRDGTFGTTGRCPPLEEDLVEALEDHAFDPIPILQWRNSELDFASIEDLQASLDRFPHEPGLTRAPLGEDLMVLDVASRDLQVRRAAKTRADVARLWDVCQVPDYRKSSPYAHAELALTLYGYVVRAGRVPDDWFAGQLAPFDRTEGDIATLSQRIAQVRTLTYIANRPDWLGDPEHWQGVTRQLEDRLSDALHERLAQRFVDRRTSVLMRRLRENAMLEAEVTAGGDVLVEGQHVGQLHGFRFTPDPHAAGEAARALNAAALKALGGEIETRAERFSAAVDESFALANDGTIRWLGDPVAKLAAGDKLLVPRARVLGDEHLTGPALETVQRRLDLWLTQHVKKHLGPLIDLESGEGLEGISRGIAFQVAEALGVLERSRVAEEMKTLDQASRATLRKLGLRFGAYHIYMPALIKPAPRALAAQLWALRNGGVETSKGLDEVPHLAASGRTSFAADLTVPKGLYRAAGFRVCGNRAVRVDILERLADLIRPAIAYHPGTTPGTPPPGAADRDGFVTTVGMTSLAGCSGEDFASILRSLGYVVDRRPGPPITVPLLPVAPTVPLTPTAAAPDPGPAAGAEESLSPPSEAAEATTGSEGSAEADEAPRKAASGPAADDVRDEAPAPGLDAEAAAPATEPAAPDAEPAAPDAEPDAATMEDTPPTSMMDVASAIASTAVSVTAAVAVSTAASAFASIGNTPDRERSEPKRSETLEGNDQAAGESPETEFPAAENPEPAAEIGGTSEPEEAPAQAARPDQPAAEIPEAEVATAEASAAEPTVSASAEGAFAEADATPAEPVLIEVWRPHRPSHNANRRPDRNRRREPQRPSVGAAAPAAEGDPGVPAAAEARRNSERRDGPGRGNDRQRDRRPGHQRGGAPGSTLAAAGPDVPSAGGVPAGERQNPKEGGRPQRAGDGKPRFEPRRNDERRDGARHEGGRHDGGRDARPQSFMTQERPARDRAPDPDSPFAKLMALKLELEQRKKEP